MKGKRRRVPRCGALVLLLTVAAGLLTGCGPGIERDAELENRVRERLAEATDELPVCGLPGCTQPAEQAFLLPDGTELKLCTTHYDEMAAQQAGNGSYTIPDGPPAEEHLCEICGRPAILSIADGSGETRYYCSEHFTVIAEDIAALGN